MESRLTIHEAMVMVSKQLRAINEGKGSLDEADRINNLAGKILKAEMVELSKDIYIKAGGKLWDTGQKQIAKA